MARYVDSIEQLVVEIFVREIGRSKRFYQQLGFELLRDAGTFVELTWEDHRLYLDEQPQAQPPAWPQANVRIMVPNVDAYWELAQSLGARVIAPIADRAYGLRDFTIADPDGFGVRFGSRLEPRSPH